ncbi:hypothetical protein AKJ52_00805 [candidate division MSBL1 archaeon SCGC-AAA382C18]|uniref:ABC transmembrane type-1 domain-containing protein n=1 Tax=candidate division MSBL1 archaeon SCGC-AAA382C18 TaxID=1698281 RepID=A0A133VL44_9EURY|nr:hypothetical protein AKJ52_00805 [candidate division MSBL1 archaeon SCGC-AAA382C18]
MAEPPAGTLIGRQFDAFVGWLTTEGQWFFGGVDTIISTVYNNVSAGFKYLPAWLLILIVAIVCMVFISRKLALINVLALVGIWGMTTMPSRFADQVHIWPWAMDTFALVFIAVGVSLLVAIPLGVLSAYHNKLWLVVRPIMDLMQTIPMWVYMIPAVLFFQMGPTCAIFATVIFALPPPLRYTNTAIRNVDQGIVEAGKSLGATTWQRFKKVELPAAVPTIMTGVNQCIMMALSMVVLAALVGAGGLGGRIIWGMLRARTAYAFEAGFAVVFTAIVIDRSTEELVEKIRQRLRLVG